MKVGDIYKAKCEYPLGIPVNPGGRLEIIEDEGCGQFKCKILSGKIGSGGDEWWISKSNSNFVRIVRKKK